LLHQQLLKQNQMSKKSKPEFIITYRCTVCHEECRFTEQDKPICRYCEVKTEMTFMSKDKITPELISANLKASTERMYSNLQSAFEMMGEEDAIHFPDGSDPEKEMLLLLDKVKKLKDDIQSLELKEPEEK
jgi:hypothetical protein